MRTESEIKKQIRKAAKERLYIQNKRWKHLPKLKSIAACFLSAAMMAGLLCGCQNKSGSLMDGQESPSKQESLESQKSLEGGTSSGEEGGAMQAMGRYRESVVELPEEVQEQNLVWFGWGEKEQLELYTVQWGTSGEAGDAFRYIFEDGTWKNDEEWVGNALLKEYGLDIEQVFYGSDGQYYLGGTDESYRFHLLKVNDDKTAQEILPEVFLPDEGKDYGLIPPKVEVLENGNLLVYSYYEVYLYTPSGSRLLTMGKDFSGNTSDARGFCDGNALVTVQGDRLISYDLQNGAMTDITGLEEVEGFQEDIILFGDGNGGVYAAGEKGLSHLHEGGSLWEILIDGSLNHMGMRSLNLSYFLPGKEQDYYGIFTIMGGKNISLFHYTYDPDMLSVPPSSLTVYSLEDRSTLRQAASQFQSDHPEIKVELRTAVEKGEEVSEEVIQSLNTELLSGRGADVLILDGLPAQAYMEKGVLMDISDLIGEMESSGLLLTNFIDGFRQDDGAIYQVPARVAFPLLVGDAKAVAAYSSLEAMAAYSGEKPLVATENYENLLRKVAHVQYPELFGQGKITQKEGLVQYLETVKTLGEANGSKTVFTSESEMTEKWVSNHVQATGITGTSINYDAGRCASGIELLDGFGDLCVPAQVKKQQPESQMTTVGKLFLPLTRAGINRSTQNAEIAREFIRCLLSYEVQKEELYDGFPVNVEALAAYTEKEIAGYSIGVGYNAWDGEDGGYELHAEWPERSVREGIAAEMKELTVPVLVDETVMKMIVEGSKDYLEDKESADQAAEKILRKLSVYLAE